MTIQQLTYFREIAVTRNYTQAAANLFVAQPSISHSIQKLEDELNVPLFIRQANKSIDLTVYGKALLPIAEKILNAHDEGIAEITRLRNPNSGIVKIACAYSSSYHVLLHLLHSFKSAERSNDIVLRPLIIHDLEKSGNFSSMLSSGDIDLMLAVNITGPNIQSVPLAYEELVVFIPNTNPLSKRSFVTLNDLRNETLVMSSETVSLNKWTMKMYQHDGIEPQIHMLDDHYDNFASLLASLVYEQEKIHIAPKSTTQYETLTSVPLVHHMNKRAINLAWANNRELSSAVNYVKDWCIDFLRDTSPVH